MNSKNALGQFYTTNSDYILEGFDIQTYNEIIEPFVGQGDILNWIKKNNENRNENKRRTNCGLLPAIFNL